MKQHNFRVLCETRRSCERRFKRGAYQVHVMVLPMTQTDKNLDNILFVIPLVARLVHSALSPDILFLGHIICLFYFHVAEDPCYQLQNTFYYYYTTGL